MLLFALIYYVRILTKASKLLIFPFLPSNLTCNILILLMHMKTEPIVEADDTLFLLLPHDAEL